MTDAELLSTIKVMIGEANPSSERLIFIQQAVNSAKSFIGREGITLAPALSNGVTNYSIEDSQLILMYAEYLIRKRETNEAMPRMLRFALNNRLFGEKAAVNED